MNGSPAYYRPERASEHVHLGTGQHLAVEAMLRTLRSSKVFEPLGVYVPWATQNGGVHWTTIGAPDHELIVYPTTAATIARVNAASYGSEVPWVAVLTEKPVQAIVAEQAWDATRYDQFTVEAVYDVADSRPSPRIRFLYWAKLHDDVGGGRESLDAVARRLGGRLVFPVQLALSSPRPLPPLPFQLVLDAQLAAQAAPARTSMGAIGIKPGQQCPAEKPIAQQRDGSTWCYAQSEWDALRAAGEGGGSARNATGVDRFLHSLTEVPWWAYAGAVAGGAWLLTRKKGAR